MKMIAGVWILSVIVSLPPLFGWKRPQPVVDGFPLCVLSEEPGYVIYSTVGSFYVPLVVIVVVYSKIYVAARRRARRSLQGIGKSQWQKSRQSRRRMMQSVSQSTMASNVSAQPRTDPRSVETATQSRPPVRGALQTPVEVGAYSPTMKDPDRSWSESCCRSPTSVVAVFLSSSRQFRLRRCGCGPG